MAWWTIPDEGEGSNNLQSKLCQSSLDGLVGGLGGAGVIQGCAVTAQGTPDMTVAVAVGFIKQAGGLPIAVAAGNVTISAADSTNPRLDLVVVNGSGVKSVITGTAAVDPIEPTLDTSTYAVLAQVYVPAAATSITSARIYDRRVPVAAGGLLQVARSSSDDAHSNTGSVQSYKALTCPGGLVAADDWLHYYAAGDAVINGSASTLTPGLLIGSTSISGVGTNSISTSASSIKWVFDIWIEMISTSSQRVSGFIGISGQNAAGFVGLGLFDVGYSTAAEDFTSDKTIAARMTMSVGNASNTVTGRKAFLSRVR